MLLNLFKYNYTNPSKTCSDLLLWDPPFHYIIPLLLLLYIYIIERPVVLYAVQRVPAKAVVVEIANRIAVPY